MTAPDLSKIHDCKECHGKMVSISVDHVGNTYCGYCGEKVDYKSWMKEQGWDEKIKEI